jgi:hypothetical protein
MKCLYAIASNHSLQIVIGCILSGFVNFGLFHRYPAIALVAVPIAIIVTAFWCSSQQRMIESLIQVLIFGVMLLILFQITLNVAAKLSQWWQIAPHSFFLGCSGGGAVGAFFGGLCRFFRDSKSPTSDVAKNTKNTD